MGQQLGQWMGGVDDDIGYGPPLLLTGLVADAGLGLFQAHAAFLDHTVEPHAHGSFDRDDMVKGEWNIVNDLG